LETNNGNNLKRRQIVAGISALPLAAVLPASAQDTSGWPKKIIKLVVGFPAGGGADGMGRLLATKLSERLGQQIIVENRPGATGTIASALVAQSPADGYTLQLAHINSNTIGPLLVGRGRFDAVKDFTPIALLGIAPQLLVLHPKWKFASVAELIKYLKANPGKMSYASSGIGSIQHIAGEAFKLSAGVDILHVPFKGTGEAMTGLISGDIDMSFSSAASVLQNVKSGKLTMLATCTPKRLPIVPNVPAIAETLPGFDVTTWYGLAGPANLPKAIVKRLNDEVRTVLLMPDVVKRFRDLGEEPGGSSPEQFSQFWIREIDKYSKLIKAANIKPV
jgi:tripartite-type tricarboxylate transporter receptor subunit TctC